MTLPLEPPLQPMLSKASETIPAGEGWVYEPKWDGFRAMAFRDGEEVRLISRNGQPLHRYFPEVVSNLRQALPARVVVDGEIVVPGARGLDFDALLQRVHPAESRIRRLAEETPATFVAFDLLALADDSLLTAPLFARRRGLEAAVSPGPGFAVTAQTGDPALAADWFRLFEGAGLDGIVAKRAEGAYLPGQRVMIKVKHHRTADCVVGGFRVAKSGSGIGSLLLGLFDAEGVLHYVGHTSSFTERRAVELREELRPLEGGTSFGGGRSPGGISRWSRGREADWVALAPERVCEVHFEQLQGGRFRHAARFLRWRPDKAPGECDFQQLQPPHPFDLQAVLDASR